MRPRLPTLCFLPLRPPPMITPSMFTSDTSVANNFSCCLRVFLCHQSSLAVCHCCPLSLLLSTMRLRCLLLSTTPLPMLLLSTTSCCQRLYSFRRCLLPPAIRNSAAADAVWCCDCCPLTSHHDFSPQLLTIGF